MILIAHRGLMNGPDKSLENKPEQIDKALKEGYDVEVDVWHSNGKWFLGHDGPITEIPFKFLKKKGLWIHCKNWWALESLTATSRKLHYFWHQTDCYTLTSKGIPWVYPGKRTITTGVRVLPEEVGDLKDIASMDKCYGICSDYVNEIRKTLNG